MRRILLLGFLVSTGCAWTNAATRQAEERQRAQSAELAKREQTARRCDAALANPDEDPAVVAACINFRAAERQRQEDANRQSTDSEQGESALAAGLAGWNAEAARQREERQPRACTSNGDCSSGQVCARIRPMSSDGACVARR